MIPINPSSKAEALRTIRTEVAEFGTVSFIKATVTRKQQVASAFSDAIRKSAGLTIQDYARQATRRAMKTLVTR